MTFRPSTLAWGALAAEVVAYDYLADTGETLSEGVDRGLEAHKALTLAAIGLTALHLANLLPEKLDPLHQGLKFVKGNQPAPAAA